MSQTNTLLALSILLLSSRSFSDDLVREITLEYQLPPSLNAHFSQVIELDSAIQVSQIGVVSDWWTKRPTEIRVYRWENAAKGKMIGFRQFLEYDDMICGPNFSSKCEFPFNYQSLLRVPVYKKVTSVIVEVDGNLEPEESSLIDAIQVRRVEL